MLPAIPPAIAQVGTPGVFLENSASARPRMLEAEQTVLAPGSRIDLLPFFTIWTVVLSFWTVALIRKPSSLAGLFFFFSTPGFIAAVGALFPLRKPSIPSI